jgi:Na+-driven multidrug efflux pump
MLIRLALLLAILFIASTAVLYLFTRDPRYPRLIWQVVRFMAYVLLVFGLLYLLESYGLVAWKVFV